MGKEYNFSKPGNQCAACQKELKPGDGITAVLRETAEDFAREDYCPPCWDSRSATSLADVVGVWQGQMPARQQPKKKLFVDNDLLINFFERLTDAEEPTKINFRFVLALVLMRKKLLVYDKAEKLPDGREAWTMHFKGSEQKHTVIDPHMDEEKIAEVSRHLDEILPTSDPAGEEN